MVCFEKKNKEQEEAREREEKNPFLKNKKAYGYGQKFGLL
jgi:hypothetical protein